MIAFLMRVEKLSFPETLAHLKELRAMNQDKNKEKEKKRRQSAGGIL